MIRAGALADLTVLELSTPRLAGASDEALLDAAVFAGSAADVRDVLVGGRFVVRDRCHVSLDVPRELSLAIRAVTA
jgi:cytosine/adenosine deaminase-related metal-dependent hydrolase